MENDRNGRIDGAEGKKARSTGGDFVEACVAISRDGGVAEAVREAKRTAAGAGFGKSDQMKVATVVSELANNIRFHAGEGRIVIRTAAGPSGRGLEIVAEDEGSGIEDVENAMRDGFSTGGGLGLGLPAVKRMSDEFLVESEGGRGTRVTVRMWA